MIMKLVWSLIFTYIYIILYGRYTDCNVLNFSNFNRHCAKYPDGLETTREHFIIIHTWFWIEDQPLTKFIISQFC